MNKSTKQEIPIGSFASKLTQSIMVVLLMMMAIVGVILFFLVRLSMAEEADTRYEGALLQTNEVMRRMLSDVYVATRNNVYEIECDLDQPDKMFEHTQRIVNLNPYMVGVGVMFEPDFFPKKGRWFEVYATLDRKTGQSEARQIGSADHDYLKSDWYRETVDNDSDFWSNPYFDDAGAKEVLVSYFMPLHNRDGQCVGLIGADMSLEWLRERLNRIDEKVNRIYKGNEERYSYSFLIDSKGRYVIHPDEKRIQIGNNPYEAKLANDTLDNYMISQLLNGNGSTRFVVDGVASRVYHMKLKHTGWVLATVVPESLIYHNGYTMGLVILAVLAVGLLLIYILSRLSIFRMSKPLTDYAARAASTEKELKIANNIQMSMLPKIFPPYPDRDDVDVYGSLTPAKDVGGDLFDFLLRDNRLFFCIGDVSGKGVPASLVMSGVKTLFRNVSAHADNPLEIVNAINRSQADSNDTFMFVTLFVGVLDLTDGRLRYCNAGHDAPLLVGAETGLLPVDSNIPVGVDAGWEFTQQESAIAPDTLVFLYTDGLTEAEDIHQEQFGKDRMLAVGKVAVECGEYEAKTFVERMEEAVREFVGGAEQSDDLTMMAVKYYKT